MPIPAYKTGETTVKLFHETARGRIILGDSLGMFREEIEPGTIDHDTAENEERTFSC